MKLLAEFNFNNYDPNEIQSFEKHNTVRAVVFDDNKKVAVLFLTGDKNPSGLPYYKLVGGHVEDGEDQVSALKREVKEEIGCEVEIVKEIGLIREIRPGKVIIESYFYIAKVVGEKGDPDPADYDTKNGFEVRWLEPAEILDGLEKSKTVDENSIYIKSRDSLALKESTKILGG